ncbi:hypothetical protein Ancab_017287 [Ancistrocladus abbreviatus]
MNLKGEEPYQAERYKGRYRNEKEAADEVFEITPLPSDSKSVEPETDDEAMNVGKVSSAIPPREANPGMLSPNPGINAPISNVQDEPKSNDDAVEFEFCEDSRRIRWSACRLEGGEKLGVSVVDEENQRSEADTRKKWMTGVGGLCEKEWVFVRKRGSGAVVGVSGLCSRGRFRRGKEGGKGRWLGGVGGSSGRVKAFGG